VIPLALLIEEGTRSAARGALPLGGNYSLADPPFLLLIPLAVLLLAWGRARGGRPTGRVPLAPGLVVRSWRQRLSWVPVVLQGLAVLLVIVSLSRPLRGNVEFADVTQGIDIALVVDRSSSMRFDDLERNRSRLDVVKDVVGDFAERRMTDQENAADNVALITFARYPQLLCPFTLDVDALLGFLDGVGIVQHREEDMTAIGVALAKAVAILEESEAKSRVVVLLTDGENNLHEITPLDAAELAAEKEIRVHTIYAGKYLFRYDPLRGFVPTTERPDTSDLQTISALTDGIFRRATDRDRLEEIYAEIEKLERTDRLEQRFEENFDLYPLFLLPAIVLYVLAWLSNATWARRLP